MTRSAVKLLNEDEVILKKARVRFPIELRPEEFRADDPASWPEVDGRLEVVRGRLLYRPPCADVQQDVAVDVVYVLRLWSSRHPGFVVGGNEAGMMLGGDIRAADAAVWSRAAAGASVGRMRHSPPLLAVEVAGQDEDEPVLREKASWYLEHGVRVVWLVHPAAREVLVLSSGSDQRCAVGARIPAHPALPELEPRIAEFFAQLDGD
jgi:Uma2 family endonuclease